MTKGRLVVMIALLAHKRIGREASLLARTITPQPEPKYTSDYTLARVYLFLSEFRALDDDGDVILCTLTLTPANAPATRIIIGAGYWPPNSND